MRGKAGAPVSFPIVWEDLEELSSSADYTLENSLEILEEKGDAWTGMDTYAVDLHTQKKPKKGSVNPPGDKHKSPEQLERYIQKRDFLKTPEPKALGETGDDTQFVIHRHDASRLHYDLRLEKSGVLLSWALPKGLPAYPGDKRLAVQTEDHPLKYLYFEGEIPKGEYGGGLMLICAQGRYLITKEKSKGFYFTLTSRTVTGEYRMHNTKESEWLIERVDTPDPSWLEEIIPPMLADQRERVPLGEEFRYELKWDGIRASLVIRDGVVELFSRGGQNMTEQFPELQNAESFRIRNGVFDGEIICFDQEGKPDFKKVMKRFQAKGASSISRLASSEPAYLYLFDVLYTDGIPLVNLTLEKRRLILEGSLRTKVGYIRLSDMLEDGEELFDATRSMGLEGIMCKDISKSYKPGKRVEHWLKVKIRNDAEVEVIGFTYGKGSLEESLGALHIAENVDGEFIYRGKVGTGFTNKTRQAIYEMLKQFTHTSKPCLPVEVPEDKTAVWLKEPVAAKVRYASVNPGGVYREPVFISFL